MAPSSRHAVSQRASCPALRLEALRASRRPQTFALEPLVVLQLLYFLRSTLLAAQRLCPALLACAVAAGRLRRPRFLASCPPSKMPSRHRGHQLGDPPCSPSRSAFLLLQQPHPRQLGTRDFSPLHRPRQSTPGCGGLFTQPLRRHRLPAGVAWQYYTTCLC